MARTEKQRKFVRALLAWYRHSGRELPWRNITDPYRILVAEIMLQQTQVSRVLVSYPRFLSRFPTLRSLASARQRDVVVAWRGMGYNGRAIRLHRAAKTIALRHGGTVPSDGASLRALPGVGEYTANALLSAAFGLPVPVVDVNVRRVFSRFFWRMATTDALQAESEVQEAAERTAPSKGVYAWNQALMDLGATVCTLRRPNCVCCPVSQRCTSTSVMRRVQHPAPKTEPSLGGIPNRIYRGRIIEQLRVAPSMRLDILAHKVHPQFAPRHSRWFLLLLEGLERDGLVTVSGNGSLKTSRVALA